jgi:hypothetical protein
MMGGRPRDRDKFPNVQEDIGEDPARYLDVERVEELQLARARIRGIDFIAVVRAWKAVERNLYPRPKVLEWLDEREAELKEIGDRDERMAAQDIEARREATPSTESVATFSDRDGEYPFSNSVDADRYRAATDGGTDA